MFQEKTAEAEVGCRETHQDVTGHHSTAHTSVERNVTAFRFTVCFLLVDLPS